MRRLTHSGAGITAGRHFLAYLLFILLLVTNGMLTAHALPTLLGDLDEDGQVTVLDLVRLINQLNGQPNSPSALDSNLVARQVFSDVNQDGLVNQSDVDAIGDTILGILPVTELPITTIRDTSPTRGETGVAVTRETVFRFNYPLATNTFLGPNHVFATFGGRRVLSRLEVSSDRRTVTLFYAEPLPGGARVRVTFDAFGLQDFLGRFVDLDGDGQAGGMASIDFDTLSLTPVSGTAIRGTVFASEPVAVTTNSSQTNFINRPLAGVTISVDGMEQTLRAVTDVNGNFLLHPCPAGDFFVHIDGRTVADSTRGIRYPEQSYYPFVGKVWHGTAGRTNFAGFMTGSTNQASTNGWVFLPLIQQGSLKTVSMTNDTLITFPASVTSNNPALAGVQLIVPPNSLFSANGTRGGRVGIAPVPPDRLPGVLPPGLEFPLVITVQTDGGENFDRPVPICFPNLPDPVTGQPLPPGTKNSLYSFNHDKGEWEVVGPMTVSADGTAICTDSGVGIVQPGWHGSGPPPTDSTGCNSMCCPGNSPCLPTARLSAREPQFQLASESCCDCDTDQNSQECKDRDQSDQERKRAECAKKEEECRKVMDDYAKDSIAGQIGNYGPNADCIINNISGWDQGDTPPPCKPCSGPSGGGVGVGNFDRTGPTHDPVIDALNTSTARMRQLVRAYAEAQQLLPTAIALEVRRLAEIPKALSGGNVDEYLDGIIARSEFTMREISARVRDPLGNAPANPVNFAAEVVRGEERFVLRGQTRAYGQYRIFVPRNGRVERIRFFDPIGQRVGAIIPTRFTDGTLPRFYLGPLDSFRDSDGDGLKDLVEEILGTDNSLLDSDSDGIPDGVEIEQGTDPLDGRPVVTGVIGSADTPGTAVDVCAINNLAIVADGAAGVTVFNVAAGQNPLRIAQVDTPGNAQRVACSGDLVAIADGIAGLAIVDISDPPAARIRYQVDLGGSAQAVTAAGGIAYVGLDSGVVIAVDLGSGTILQQSFAGNAVVDLALGGDYLYALTTTGLRTFSLRDGDLSGVGPVLTFGSGHRRLTVGQGYAHAVQLNGVNTLSLANPAAPVLVTAANSTQRDWRQLIPNGSGLAVTADDATFGLEGPNDVSIYDLRDPSVTDADFITRFSTPGNAFALSIYNGLAYVADGEAGLQVVNYLPYDNRGSNPAVALAASFSLVSSTNGTAEEGKQVRITASATDDVQVRNVEFYIDGQLAVIDGNFPFEHRFVTPVRAGGRTNFTIRAKATDTGGNVAWTPEAVIVLVPDATPPRVSRVTPRDHAITRPNSVGAVFVRFSEPVQADKVSARLKVLAAGPDGALGTADDQLVVGDFDYREDLNLATVTFATPLPTNSYLITLDAGVSDRAGNATTNRFTSSFRVFEDSLASGSLVVDGGSSSDGLPDVISFTAIGDESVRISFVGEGGASATVTLREPGGRILNSSSGVNTQWEQRLSTNGVHTVTVSGNGVGTYLLAIQRLWPQPTATLVPYGTVTNGLIARRAGQDVYRFNAQANDFVRVTLFQTTVPGPAVSVRLYDPQGTYVTEFSANSATEQALLRTGSYYLIVRANDLRNTNVGYTLGLQKVLPVGVATPINYGDVVSSVAALAGEQDVYRFNAQSNDFVRVTLFQATVPGPAVSVRLYDPQGTYVTEFSSTSSSEQALLRSGSYSLIVRANDLRNTNVGYTLGLQKVLPVGVATPINYGDVVSSVVALAGEQDVYRFNAQSNDFVRVTLFQTTVPGPAVSVRLYDPQGTYVSEFSSTSSSEQALLRTGSYSLIVWANDLRNTNVGYTLGLQKVLPVGVATPINYGDVVSSVVALAGEQDVYRFNAQSNDFVRVTLFQTTVPGPAVSVRLYDPQGTYVTEFSSTSSSEQALLRTGSYSLIVRANDLRNTNVGYIAGGCRRCCRWESGRRSTTAMWCHPWPHWRVSRTSIGSTPSPMISCV